MNDKNNALFFNEDNDFNAVITLTDEDGNDMDMEAVAALEIHELGKEYIAVVPTEPNDEFEDGEVLLLINSSNAALAISNSSGSSRLSNTGLPSASSE